LTESMAVSLHVFHAESTYKEARTVRRFER